MEHQRNSLPSNLNTLTARMGYSEETHRAVVQIIIIVAIFLVVTLVVAWISAPSCCGGTLYATKRPSYRPVGEQEMSRMEAGLQPAPRAIVNDRSSFSLI